MSKSNLEKREIQEVIEDDESITIVLNKEGYEKLDTEEIVEAIDETIMGLLAEEDIEETEDEIDEEVEDIEDDEAEEKEDEEEVEELEDDIDDDEDDIDDDEDEIDDLEGAEEPTHEMPDGTIMEGEEHEEEEAEELEEDVDEDEEEEESAYHEDEEDEEKGLWDKKDTTEKRFFKVETRVSSKGKKNIVEGHAAVFGDLSEDLGGFREKILPGAFDNVLGDDVRAFFNHDPNFLLARSSSGTLKLGVDKKGLKYSFEVPDTSAGRDLLVSMKRGDINQSSFAFTVEKDSWKDGEKGMEIRTIEKVGRLFDVSPVSIPAYPTANDLSIAQRSRMINKDKTKMKNEVEYEYKRSLLELKINILKRK